MRIDENKHIVRQVGSIIFWESRDIDFMVIMRISALLVILDISSQNNNHQCYWP